MGWRSIFQPPDIAQMRRRWLFSCDMEAAIHWARRDTPRVIGATLGWDFRATRCFEWADGFRGILAHDRRFHPEAYDSSGWPLDLKTGLRLEITE